MSNEVGRSKMPLFSRFFGAFEGVHIPMCVKEFFRARVRRLAGGVCLSDATTKKRRPRQEDEDLLLTMRLDGHQVKIAYTAEPCCQ